MSRHRFIKRSAVPSTTIADVEEVARFPLPEDYKKYLTSYDKFEGEIGPEYLQLWDIDELIRLNIDYNAFELLPNTLMIGSNMGGEFIAVEFLDTDSYRVVLSPFIDMDSEYHIEIGNSFSDMVERLNAGKEWFE
jgi:hypothetical protein